MSANLPNELVRHILQFLPKRKYFDCFTVCKKWKEIILSPSILWRHLNLSEEVLEKLSDQQLQTLLDRSVGLYLEKAKLWFIEDDSITRQVLECFAKKKVLPIKKLSLQAKVFPDDHNFVEWCRKGFPLLQSMTLGRDLPIDLVKTLMYLPTVEKIRLKGYSHIKLEKPLEIKSLMLRRMYDPTNELSKNFFQKIKGLKSFRMITCYIEDLNSLDCSNLTELMIHFRIMHRVDPPLRNYEKFLL